MQMISKALLLGVLFIAGPAAHAAPDPLPRALQATIDKAVAANPDVPGITLSYSAAGGRQQWSGSAGRTAIGGKDALQPDQPFRIASITKLFVAATILRLHEQHRLAVTDTIMAHISPETAGQLRRAGYDPAVIRIDQLLTHSSGMADHTTEPGFLAATLGTGGHHWTRAAQLAILARQKPLGAPGVAFHYSDSGYVVLGEIIERATGKPLAAAVREQLQFRKIGLASTWWEQAEPAPPGVKPRAHQYQGDLDVTDMDASFDLFGGGGLVSTTADLNRFLRALITGRLFDQPQTLALALAAPRMDLGERGQIHALVPFLMPFGNHLCWQHGGHWGSNAFYCPDIDVAIAYTVNQNQSPLYRGLAATLAPIVDAALNK